jgi:hypothetical protein
MGNLNGTIRQFDAIEMPNPNRVRTLVIVTPSKGEEMQVFTEDPQLQAALALAFGLKMEAAFSYEDGLNKLERVTIPPAG